MIYKPFNQYVPLCYTKQENYVQYTLVHLFTNENNYLLWYMSYETSLSNTNEGRTLS